MRLAPLLLFALTTASACMPREAALARAQATLTDGRPGEARERYARIARARDQRIRVRACLGAAHASTVLRDPAAERQWLERAVADPEVPGVSEDAYFELAELLRKDGNRAQALNFYYRAAAAAQRTHRRDVYDRSIHAIAYLGLTE